MLFYIRNTFISNAKLKLAKNKGNTMRHSEAELLLFENYSHSFSTLSSNNNETSIMGHILKNKQKNKCVCVHNIIQLITVKMKMKMKNRFHRYYISRPRSRHV